MRPSSMARALPTFLSLMGLAVILIISGASAVGFAFGLVVAGIGGVVLVSMVLHEVTHRSDGHGRGERRPYRRPRPTGF